MQGDPESIGPDKTCNEGGEMANAHLHQLADAERAVEIQRECQSGHMASKLTVDVNTGGVEIEILGHRVESLPDGPLSGHNYRQCTQHCGALPLRQQQAEQRCFTAPTADLQ